MLITVSKVLHGSPTLLSSSSALSQPILDASFSLEEHNGDAVLQDAENPALPGLVEISQESSGFSEDSEENKGPLALRKWDVQAEINSSLNADSLIGM